MYSGSANAYENDNVVIYLDLSNLKSPKYTDTKQGFWELYWYKDGVGGRKGKATGEDWVPYAVSYKKIINEDVDYVMEAAVAFSDMDYKPVVGNKIGFDVKINDNDGEVRDQYAWRDRSDNGWQYPWVFGTIDLQAEGSVLGIDVEPQVDGKIDPFWDFSQSVQANSVIDTNTGTGASDFSNNFRMRYTKDSIYFFIEVKDDILYSGSANAYENDNVVVYWDLKNLKSDKYIDPQQSFGELYWFKEGVGGRKGIATGEDWVPYNVNYKKVFEDGVGYSMEAAISWADMGYTPVVNDTIGFDIKFNDNDGEGCDQFAWMDISDNGWQWPKVFGSVKLLEDGYFQGLTSRPTSVANLEANVSDSVVTLTWNTANGASSYQISLNNAVIGISEEPTFKDTLANGTYLFSVRSVDENRVVSNAVKVTAKVAVVDAIKGTSSISFSIIPNPAVYKVKITSVSDIKEVIVTDILGKEVFRQSRNNSKSILLSTGSLNSGIYIMSVKDDQGNYASKKCVIK